MHYFNSERKVADGEGLRQRKARQTWEAINQAARSLALERSVGDISVQEIADSANVSVRTVFNYFSSKEDAVLGIRGIELPSWAVERFLAARGPLLDDAADLLFDCFQENRGDFSEAAAMRELLDRNPELAHRLIKDIDQFEAKLADIVLARAGDQLAAAAASAVAGRLCGLAIDAWIRTGGVQDQRQTLREAVAALHRVM